MEKTKTQNHFKYFMWFFIGLAIALPIGYTLKWLFLEPFNWWTGSAYYPGVTLPVNETVYIILAIYSYRVSKGYEK